MVKSSAGLFHSPCPRSVVLSAVLALSVFVVAMSAWQCWLWWGTSSRRRKTLVGGTISVSAKVTTELNIEHLLSNRPVLPMCDSPEGPIVDHIVSKKDM